MEYLFIKKENEICTNRQAFKDLLKTNNQISFSGKHISICGKCYSYEITCTKIQESNQICFHMKLQNKEVEIETLSKADLLIKHTFSDLKDWKIVVLWDDVSMYYTKELYGPISLLENTARKVINLFMIKAVGSEWYKTYISSNLKEELVKLQKKKIDDIESTDNIMLFADFIDITSFLFEPYPIKRDVNAFIEEVKNSIDEKNKLDDIFLKYEFKSNWDRFFKNEVKCDDFSSDWENAYYYRNKVAHNLSITKREYEEAIKLISKLSKTLQMVVDKVDDIQITEEEISGLNNFSKISFSPILGSLSDTMRINLEYFKNITSPIIQATNSLLSDPEYIKLRETIDSLNKLNINFNNVLFDKYKGE